MPKLREQRSVNYLGFLVLRTFTDGKQYTWHLLQSGKAALVVQYQEYTEIPRPSCLRHYIIISSAAPLFTRAYDQVLRGPLSNVQQHRS